MKNLAINLQPLIYGAFPVCRNYTAVVHLCVTFDSEPAIIDRSAAMTGPKLVGNHSLLIAHLEYETKLDTLNVLILSLRGVAFGSGLQPRLLGQGYKAGEPRKEEFGKTLVDFLSESGV